jgi:uncharacterized protein YndB with AHSA1/START domain
MLVRRWPKHGDRLENSPQNRTENNHESGKQRPHGQNLSDEEVRVTRTFDAPRNLVFDAWTKPELLRRWLGSEADELIVCDVDLRVGGTYRFVWRTREGGEMGLGGVYRDVVANERIVVTENFDPPYDEMMGGAAVTTTVFEERDGKTTLTSTTRYRSRDARDGAIATGNEEAPRKLRPSRGPAANVVVSACCIRVVQACPDRLREGGNDGGTG